MKKTLIALAALAATSAFAQSSVTLNGSFNYGVKTTETGTHTYGGWKGDRNHLTFTAVEDLGGGLTVSGMGQIRFNSATGGVPGYVNSVNGTTGDQNLEQTKVTVNSAFGQVAVGRFTNAVGVGAFHPFEDSAQSTAAHQAANGRWSGQVQYMSPVVSGFQVFALNAQKTSNVFMGGNTGAGYSGAQDYSVANLATNVSAARRANPSQVGLNYNNGPVSAQYAQITDMLGQEQTKLSGTYDLGVAKLYATTFNQKTNIGFSATAAAATKGMAAHTATELAATVPYGNFLFKVGRFSTNKDLDLSKTDGSTKASKTAWGADYSLSKRTTLMYVASTVSNGSANLNNAGLVTGRTQFVGIQHTF
jgi:hypothetical protein